MRQMQGLLKSSPLYQMKNISPIMQPMRLGDQNLAIDVAFTPGQRDKNQMATMSQVQNYAASKQMAEQNRADMRGNVVGYSDTLG